MEYLIKEKWSLAESKDGCICLTIFPFEYNDDRKPRLPRKNSDGYDLRLDINSYFSFVFTEILKQSHWNRFKVELIVNCGNDRLGKADLDNYCKAIFDGITHTKKVWNDDKEIDELIVKRVYENVQSSFMTLKISPIIQ